jgi:hypothetical protein
MRIIPLFALMAFAALLQGCANQCSYITDDEGRKSCYQEQAAARAAFRNSQQNITIRHE